MPDLTSNLPIGFMLLTTLAVVTLIFIVLYLREFYLRQQTLKQPNKLLEESQEKSLSIIHDAIKKSEQIISQAELAGIQTTSDSQTNTNSLEKQYLDQLAQVSHQAQAEILKVKEDFNRFLAQLKDQINESQMVKQSENALNKTSLEVQESLTKTESGFSQFLEELKTTITEAQSSSQEVIKQQVNHQFEKFEQNLSDFLTQTEQQSTQAVELEVKSARQLIDTYKSQQLALIDENIIAMLERTLSLVLIKKLSLQDQVELVYQALEKAKIESFII